MKRESAAEAEGGVTGMQPPKLPLPKEPKTAFLACQALNSRWITFCANVQGDFNS